MPGFNPRTFTAQRHQPIQKKVKLGSAGVRLQRNAMQLPVAPRKPKVVTKHPTAKPIAKKSQSFKPPKDGTVRRIASCAAKKEHKASKTRWNKIFKPYCREMMGYADKGLEVEEFLYIRLKQTVDGWRTTNSTMDTHQMVVALERTATQLFDEIKSHLILLTTKGRRVKASSSHDNHQTVMITLGMKASRKAFIVFKSFADCDPEIVSVKSAREFRRGVRNRFNRQERTRRQEEAAGESLDYRNVPRVMRH